MFKTLIHKLVCALVVSCLLVGCGEGKETVEGNLFYNDSPLTLQGDDEATITFVHEEGKGSYTTNLTKESPSFTLMPAGDEPMAPGKYKVAVAITSYSKPTGKNGQEMDKLRGKYSLARTPLKYEVAPGEKQKIIVDLGKQTVTRQ